MAWRKVIEACMEDVKHHFDDIQQAIEFGCYIQPDNYFVSYIFATDSQLETARQSGLTEQINSYHREQLIKSHYPIEGIKDCTFASQEECDREFGGNLAGIGTTTTNNGVCTMTSSAVVTEMSGRNKRRRDGCISKNTGATLLAAPTTV